MRVVLVTGGAGFIGSNFIPWYMKENPYDRIVNMDALTYAGSEENLKEIDKKNDKYFFTKVNICDRDLVERTFISYGITDVIHFAAESHVDNSISGPEAFIRTNINGTFTLLDVARQYWTKTGLDKHRFLHVSTDEVYGSLGETGLFTETTPYAPNSPYSASKASSDLLVRSYHHTYGLNTVTTNCSNNYGPKQHKEKLIPTIIRKALSEQPIPIYGDGKNIRDWLYVLDHAKGIGLAFKNGRSGETYNIGGRNERTNNQIADTICGILDKTKPRASGRSYRELLTFVKDRAGHDRRYAIDATKIEKELGWKAAETFDSGIVKTVEWYLSQHP